MDDNKKHKKTLLFFENPYWIEQKKKVESYLNSRSKTVFIIMLVVIALSIALSVISSLTRERRSIKAPVTNIKTLNNSHDGIGSIGSLIKEYKELKSKEKEVNEFINEIEENYENRPER